MASEELLVCGLRAARALLDSGRMHRLVVGGAGQNPRLYKLADDARRQNIPVKTAGGRELERLAEGGRHQNAVAFGAPPTADLAEILQDKNGVLLALDGVTDTGNLGAILRIGRAFGAAAVILPRRRTAALRGAARASAGAVAYLPVLRAANLARALRQVREAGWTLAGAAEDGAEGAFPPPPVCWVLGDEEGGLRRLSRELCDVLARAPTIAGEGGCLNVAAAAAVCLAGTRTAEAANRAGGGRYSPPSSAR